MRRGVLLGLLAYGLVLAGLLMVDGRFLVLALPLWVYLGAALIDTPAPPKLAVTRTIDRPVVTEGQPVTVTLTVRNEGAHDALLAVTDLIPADLPVREGEVERLAHLSPGETMTLTYTLASRRGSFHLDGVAVTASEPLCLLQHGGEFKVDSQIVVLPRVEKWRPVRLRPARTLGFTGPIPSRRGGAGTDVHGVREYHPGDPLRRINWRATARYHDRAFTTEFEQERITDVGLILDLRRQCALEVGGESLLDHSARATAALSETLLRDGHRVGLLMYGTGQQWVLPGYGRMQQHRILRALAAATAAESMLFDSLRYLSTRLFPARSQLIFVSPLMPDDHEILFRLRAHGYSVLVVCPDIVAFQAEAAKRPFPAMAVRLARLERAALLRQLRQGGILVADWPVGGALEDRLYAATVERRL